MAEPDRATGVVVTLRDAAAGVPSGRELVRVPELQVRAGERIAIVGRSGAGKTQLLRLLGGAPPPGIVHTGQRTATGRVGFIAQDSLGSLNPLVRCLDQVALIAGAGAGSRSSRDDAARSALSACGIGEELYDRYPLQLSGGQRQRVSIAAALASRPALIIADEPTSALDPVATIAVIDALTAAAEETGAAVAMSTHDRGAARRFADRVLVVSDGDVEEADRARL